nr:PQQ-dependent sugar dehydrogenase [Akkermansiaceae bacterium]
MRFLICITTFLSLCLGSTRASGQSYGLDSAPPFAAYLNGKFPTLSPDSLTTLATVNAFPGLSFDRLMLLTPYPKSNHLAIVTQPGLIYRFENRADVTNADVQTILDISSRVRNYNDDEGMTGLAFHPEFGQADSTNRGYIYVTYRWRPNPDGGAHERHGYIRLSRFTVPDGQTAADPDSELVLVQNFDRQTWHDAGCLIFGLDGYLYFSIGDEGGENDEFNVAQRIDARLHAGIFRIDVDQDPARSHAIQRQPSAHPDLPAGWPASYTANYFVPNDNPFVTPDGSVLEEYYALGLRNPYRFSQDPVTGKIWIGDVGQYTREEVNILQAGANYGWPFREGVGAGPQARPASIIGTLKEPIWDYGRDQGNCVIGGYVYRGEKFAAELAGKYICSDHTNPIFALTTSGETHESVEDLGNLLRLRSCGLDANGEIYFLDTSHIYTLARRTASEPEPPALLSQTGAFTNLATLTPSTGFIPYDVNSPFWSDNAAKKRWMAVPNDGTPDTPQERITFSANREWQFPSGTVFVKHFELPIDDTNPALTQRLETRFLVIDREGGSYGVTYRWRADGSDADLLTTRASQDYTIATADGGTRSQTWPFPSRLDCTQCHNSNSKHVLGAKTYQLNRDLLYPVTGRTDNQLRALAHVGLLSGGLFSEAQIPEYPRARGLNETDASLEIRARSYLDSNCSHCHRPGGVRARFDARFTTPLAEQNLINGMPGANINGPNDRYIRPRDLTHSLTYERANRVGQLQMPPLAKNVVDTAAMEVIAAWINNLGASVSVRINQEKTFAANDFPFSNLGSGVTQGEIKLVTALPTHGKLYLNGNEITSIPSAPILRTSIHTLTYTPDENYTGPDSFKFQVRDAADFGGDVVMTIDVTPIIPVLNGSFEERQTGDSNWSDGAWMYIPSPWIANTGIYGRIRHDRAGLAGLSASPGGETWIANLTDAGHGVLTQNLNASVNAGDPLSVTFYICRDEYGSGVLEASFMVGDNAYSQTFDTSSLAVNTWTRYTLTQTVGVGGPLSLRFKNLSGRAGWLDKVSNVSVIPSGSGNTPTITGGTLSDALSTSYGTASSPGSFTVNGVNMTSGIQVTAPTGFEASQAFGSGYAPTITVGAAGTIPATTVYVRLAETAPVGTYNSQNIVLSSTGATSVNVTTTASGNYVGAPPPVITLAGTLGAVNTTYGTASATPTSFQVSGSALIGNLTVTPPTGYEVSLSSGSGYTTSLTITASGTLTSTQVFVRLSATAGVGNSPYSGSVTVSGGGASSKTIATASSAVSKATPTATLALSNSPVTYDGTAKSATVVIATSSVPGVVQNILTG